MYGADDAITGWTRLWGIQPFHAPGRVGRSACRSCSDGGVFVELDDCASLAKASVDEIGELVCEACHGAIADEEVHVDVFQLPEVSV